MNELLRSRDPLALRDFRRKLVNVFMVAVLFMMALIAVVPLVNIFVYVARQGWPALNHNFITQLPKPVGETGGGMANALVGTMILVGLASLIGVPIGVGTGIYLSEYGRGKFPATLRFIIDLMTSIPSIIIGLFVYVLLVIPMKGFSAYAGGVSLAIIMIPTIARTTEELLRLVPQHIREAGLALGIPRWKVTLRIVVRGSVGGIMTGVMLAIARAAGETAPLLLTALNNRFWATSLKEPISSLSVQIYTYAISPFDDWHHQAWAAALLLVGFVFVLNLTTRLALRRPAGGRD